MKIALLCRQDTGGQSFKLARAIREYTGHEARSFRSTYDYLKFPLDVSKQNMPDSYIRGYLTSADIVHCHGKYDSARPWPPTNPEAKWVIHQHGRPGKLWNVWKEEDRRRGAFRICSTPNLLPYVENDPCKWLPAPIRLAEFDILKSSFYKSLRRRGRKILIGHSPTRRDYKGTNHLIRAVKILQRKGHNIHLVLIEGKPYAEALRLKAACDITLDQMHLAVGNSGLESMAFGQATIVGMPPKVRRFYNDVVGYEPFLFSMPDTLVDVLHELVVNSAMRAEFGDRGRRYIKEWHDDFKVAKKLVGIYERLLQS